MASEGINRVLFSSKSDNWRTPTKVFKYLENKYPPMFDPCPYMSDFDGLSIEWKENNYVNPPFSQISKWVGKSIEQHKLGKNVLMLIPARTDTKYFKELYEYGCDFTFIIGRLNYNDAGSAPFPSVFVDLKGNGYNRLGYIEKRDMV